MPRQKRSKFFCKPCGEDFRSPVKLSKHYKAHPSHRRVGKPKRITLTPITYWGAIEPEAAASVTPTTRFGITSLPDEADLAQAREALLEVNSELLPFTLSIRFGSRRKMEHMLPWVFKQFRGLHAPPHAAVRGTGNNYTIQT